MYLSACAVYGMYSVSRGKNPRSVPAALPYVEIAFDPDVISVFIFGSRARKFKFWKAGNERDTELLGEGVRKDRLAESSRDC